MATVAYVGAPGGIKAGTTSDFLNIGYYLDPTIQTKIEIVCTFEDLSDTICVVGNHFVGSNSDQPNFSFYHTGAGVLAGVWWGYAFTTTKTIEINKTYTIEFDLMNGSQKMFVDGEQVHSNSYSGKIKCTNSFYLFARNQSGTITANMSTYIKSFKIWENNVLVRSFDPYLSNNARGLYDSVIDTFYQMSSSSVILDANKTRKVKEIYVGVQDYIQSTGSQYFETSVIAKTNVKVKMLISFDEIPTETTHFFGNNYGSALRYGLCIWSNGNWGIMRNGSIGYSTTESYAPVVGTKYLVEAMFGSTTQTLSINGTQILTRDTELVDSGNEILELFNYVRNAGTIKMKLYSCQIYYNNNLVADYAPYNNGLWDSVSNSYKAGNGTFVQGPQLTRKVKRGYVGVGNQTRIFYRTGTYFSSSIVPTSWGTTSTTSNFSASNDYGTWNIYSSANSYSTTYALSKAFDTSSTSYFRRSGATSTETEVILTAPEGIHIKPEKITARLYSCYDPQVYGSNDGSTYSEIAHYNASIGGATDVDFNLSGNNNTYYRYFKLKLDLGDGSTGGRIYDFKIPSGWVDKD